MIGGLVGHDGGEALAVHLSNARENDYVRVYIEGLTAANLSGAIAELKLMATGCRAKKPLIHAWASPSIHYTEAHWQAHRTAFEREFGVEGHPRIEIRHRKSGKGGRTAEHRHWVYLRIGLDGKAVSLSNSAARTEKISRICEHMNGERLISGIYNRSVIAHLLNEGHEDVAASMLIAGLDEVQAGPSPSSKERAMTQRCKDLAADEVWLRCYRAWCRADSGPAFRAALEDAGLRLAMGQKTIVVMSPGGAVHPLLRSLNKGGARAAGKALRKADLDKRLGGMDLPMATVLKPVPGFEAGLHGITGLDRSIGVPDAPEPMLSRPDVVSSAEPPPPVAQPETILPEAAPQPWLSPEQERALIELEDTFASKAAARAAAIRAEIAAEVELHLEHERRLLRERIEAETNAWKLPQISVPDWRNRYRAELAGLPREVGALLAWVDRLDAKRSRVRLKSGAMVTLAPEHVRADHAAKDRVAVMIAHAVEQGWQEITVFGGNNAWQIAMAKAATKAGIHVVDAHLQSTVATEKTRLQRIQLLQRWAELRRDLPRARQEGWFDAAMWTEIRELFAELDAELGIERLVADDKVRRLFIKDLEAYRQSLDQELDDETAPHSSGKAL